MTIALNSSAQRVQDYLSATGGAYKVQELPGSTRTAQDAADSVGCSVAQIAKSLIFKEKGADRLMLIIASGVNRVDLNKIKAATGISLEKAKGAMVKEKTGFAIGGVPPVGHTTPIETVLDRDLQQYQTIWAAAGTPHAVFQLTPQDLAQLTGGAWIELAEDM